MLGSGFRAVWPAPSAQHQSLQTTFGERADASQLAFQGLGGLRTQETARNKLRGATSVNPGTATRKGWKTKTPDLKLRSTERFAQFVAAVEEFRWSVYQIRLLHVKALGTKLSQGIYLKQELGFPLP